MKVIKTIGLIILIILAPIIIGLGWLGFIIISPIILVTAIVLFPTIVTLLVGYIIRKIKGKRLKG